MQSTFLPRCFSLQQVFVLGAILASTLAPAYAADANPKCENLQKEWQVTMEQLRLEISLQQANVKVSSIDHVKPLVQKARSLYTELNSSSRNCF